MRNTAEDKPIEIGLLQRYATDALMATGRQPFERGPATGKRIAVVGAGPAGLACAHRLAVRGHEVTIYEAKAKPGGLNEFGIAAYKTIDGFAQREVEYILGIGGIAVEYGKALGDGVTLAGLRRDFDAVFLGLGMGAVNALGLEAEDAEGVEGAVAYIADLRQADDYATLPVGRRIVVVGGGMTAIDIAAQTKRLGAEDVTIVYRRGREKMNASDYEQAIAQTSGVKIKHDAQPVRLIGESGRIEAIEFEYTRADGDGRLKGTGEHFTIAADVVFKAIGQKLVPEPARRRRRRARHDRRPHRRRRPAAQLAGRRLGRWRLRRGRGGPDGRRGRGRQDRGAFDRRRPERRRLSRRRRGAQTTGDQAMADIRNDFVGIKSPNPFWLASAPPTDKEYNVVRAFKAGWGGGVWKTLGEDPPIVNVNGPRYGAIHSGDRRVIGFNNVELITDRPLDVNLREIKQVKRDWPDRAVVVSLMVPCEEAAW